jgi:hypothetical protein
VDLSNTISDDTPEPDSPLSEKHISYNANYETPIPVLQPMLNLNDEQNTGGRETNIFFILHINIHLVVQIVYEQYFLSLIIHQIMIIIVHLQSKSIQCI